MISIGVDIRNLASIYFLMQGKLMKKIWFLVVVNTLAVATISAQSVDSIYISKKQGKLLSVDELSNIYIVDKKNGITKYNETGDSIAFFQQLINGPIASLDVTDPMRLLVYYPNFNKVLLLDRMLGLNSTIDLKLMGINQPSAVATAKDGGFWVYDYSQFKMLKFDRQMKKVVESNDLRLVMTDVPKFNLILEHENELWALSDVNVLFVFTRYGELVNTYPLGLEEEIINMQREGNQLIYSTNKNAFVFDINSQQKKNISLTPLIKQEIKGIEFTKDKVYLLQKDGVYTFQIQ